MNKITRNKAAEILGVHPQTISNYMRDGLLSGYKDEKGNVYVNGDDVEKYKQKYKLIAVNEKFLDMKLANLKAMRKDADKEIAELQHAMTGWKKSYIVPQYVDFIKALYHVALVPGFYKREFEILTAFMDGEKLEDLAEKYGLARERVRQIVAKSCLRFSSQTERIRNCIHYNDELELQVKSLKFALRQVQEQYDAYRVKHSDKPLSVAAVPPEILHKNISDFNFSARVLNNLCNGKVEINTIGDLLMNFSSLEELRDKTRNLGRKSLSQIEDFMYDLGLVFIRPHESKEEYYIRLNESLKDYIKEVENHGEY